MQTELAGSVVATAKQTPTSSRRAALLGWLASGVVAAVWLLMVLSQPQLTLSYTPEQLSTIISQGAARGFYKPETDAAGHRYSWTSERAIVLFDFEGRKPLVLQVSLRSAALAGGPDGAVRVLANAQEVGQFAPDPANPEFQTFTLQFTPPATASQQLRLELLAPAFKPAGDPRTLGTMVSTIRVDKSAGWSTVGKRSWLFYLWAGFIIVTLGLKLSRQPFARVAGTFLAGLASLTAGLIFGLLFSLGVVERETYRLWQGGALCLLVFALSLTLQNLSSFYAPAPFFGSFRLALAKSAPLVLANVARFIQNRLAQSVGLVLVSGLALYSQFQFDTTLYWLDLNIYLEAGRKVVQGQNAYQPFIIGTSFFYPPPALLFFAPLSTMPLAIAHWVWLIFSGLCYSCSLALLWRTFRFNYWFGLPALFYLPFWETLSVGQINNVVLLGLSLFSWGYQRAQLSRAVQTDAVSAVARVPKNSAWLSAAGLVLAIWLKMTPALLLFPTVFAWQWRTLGRLWLILGLVSLLPLLLWGWNPWLDFFKVLPNLFLTGTSSRSYSLAPTLDWLLTGLHDGEQSATAITVSRLLAAVLIISWLWLAVSFRQAAQQAILASGVVVLTISSSIVWYHHFVFLLIPLGYLLGTKQTANVLTAILALGLLQTDHLAQKIWSIPPLLSTVACLMLFSLLTFSAIKNRSLLELEDSKNAIPK